MRIAFFGSSLVSSYWNGAATYYRGIVRALAERGHEIVFHEPDAYDRQSNRDIADPPWAQVVVWDPSPGEARKHVQSVHDFDVVNKQWRIYREYSDRRMQVDPRFQPASPKGQTAPRATGEKLCASGTAHVEPPLRTAAGCGPKRTVGAAITIVAGSTSAMARSPRSVAGRWKWRTRTPRSIRSLTR